MKHHVVIAALVLLAAPVAVAGDGPAEESDWGRCQAYYASEQGNESSQGAAHNNTGFEGINSNCDQQTSPPYEDTPAEDRAGEDPGKNGQDPGSQAPDDPGSQAPDDPGSQAPDDPGSQAPDDPGSQAPDDPGSQAPDNPGDDERPDDPGDRPNGQPGNAPVSLP